jgi:phosphatidyl-myo-inositol alpha-mannosyltransferase
MAATTSLPEPDVDLQVAPVSPGAKLPASAPRPRKTIRVLHVINGEHFAGAERVQDLLALRLPDYGIEVGFACVKPGCFPAARRSQSTPLANFPMRSRFDLPAAWRLARLIRNGKFDLVHTHTPRTALVGNIAARLTGRPLVHHVHGQTVSEIGRGWLARTSARVEKFSLANAAAVIAVSPSAADYIERWGVPFDRIEVIPNGVPGRVQLAQRPRPNGDWTIGTIALFRPRKGLEVLLEAIAALHERGLPIRLRAVGGFETADYEQQIHRRVAELGIVRHIDWRGFQQNIDDELNAMNLMVLPSLLPEGMPMVVLEAMAAGVPPIGSRVEGIADVIEHAVNGLLAPPGDSVALADTIASVINGRHDWQSLRRSAIAAHAARYSDRSMAAAVAEVYRKAIFP